MDGKTNANEMNPLSIGSDPTDPGCMVPPYIKRFGLAWHVLDGDVVVASKAGPQPASGRRRRVSRYYAFAF